MKITLTAAQAATLGKAIAPAISADKIRMHLTTVHVATADDSATFTATDGYRMHRITVPYSSDGTYAPFNLAGVDFVTALGQAAKAIGKGSGHVVIEHDIDRMWIIGGGLTKTIERIDIDFPPCDSIIGAAPETEPDAYFHGPYMAELITAASVIAGKVRKGHHDVAGMVKIENIHPRKPMHVRSSSVDTCMTFHGILMPQRYK